MKHDMSKMAPRGFRVLLSGADDAVATAEGELVEWSESRALDITILGDQWDTGTRTLVGSLGICDSFDWRPSCHGIEAVATITAGRHIEERMVIRAV